MEPARVTLEDLSPVRKRIQVEISATDVQAELERAFRLVGRQARLPGFRPGRVPRPVLERNFGEQVRREVLGRLVEESFRQAIETHRLEPVGTPDIDADPLTPGQSLRYSATVDVRPVIEVGNLQGLELRRPSTTVTDEAVEGALGRLRESAAQLRPIADRAVVETHDIVRVDLTSRLEGAESVHREGVLVEAGAGAFPLALERQLVGQHIGAQLALRVPYPRDYPNAGLAGKTAEFDVEIRELRAKELPPLGDDFARDHGRCQSLAELRTRLRADLEREAEMRAIDAVRESLLDQLIARHPFDVRSEEHTSELQSPYDLVCRLLLEKKKNGSMRRDAEVPVLRPGCERWTISAVLVSCHRAGRAHPVLHSTASERNGALGKDKEPDVE